MADVVLSAELQAKVDEFVSNLIKAANQADKTSNSVSNLSKNVSANIANVNKQNISAFQNNQLSVVKSTTAASSSIEKLTETAKTLPIVLQAASSGAADIGDSLTDVTSTAEDAGLSIDSLAEVVGGGLSLATAFAALTFVVSLYEKNQQKLNKTVEDSRNVGAAYIETLGLIEQIQLKGAESGQKELTNLKLVYEAYQNANLPLKARKEAYLELQSNYPEYFKNIKFEEEASSKTATAYALLTQEILATARARAASDKITQNETRKLENENKITDLQKEQLKNQSELQKARQREASQSLSGGSTGGVSTNVSDLQRVSSVQGLINNNLTRQNELKTDTKLLDEQNAKLVTYVNTQLEKGGKILDSNAEKAAVSPKIKSLELQLPENQNQIFSELFKKISSLNAPGTLTVKAPEKIKIDVERSEIELQNFDPEKLKKEIDRLKILSSVQKIGEDAQKGVQDLFAIPNTVGLVSDAIGRSFEAMGEAIASGGDALAAAGKVLQSLVGGIMAALGQQLITLGAAKVAAGILATPFGGKLVAEGAGLIAIGAGLALAGGVVKNIGSGSGSNYSNVKQVRGFATGGNNVPAGLALVGERGPELVNLPTGSSVYNNNRSMDMLSGMGGGSVIINGNFDIGLEKLYVRLEQVGKKMGRKS